MVEVYDPWYRVNRVLCFNWGWYGACAQWRCASSAILRSLSLFACFTLCPRALVTLCCHRYYYGLESTICTTEATFYGKVIEISAVLKYQI